MIAGSSGGHITLWENDRSFSMTNDLHGIILMIVGGHGYNLSVIMVTKQNGEVETPQMGSG